VILITANASGEFQFNAYALLIIVATICYGINLNLIKHHIPDLGALTITGVSLFLVASAGVNPTCCSRHLLLNSWAHSLMLTSRFQLF